MEVTRFKINTLEEYLAHYKEEADRHFIHEQCAKLKQKIYQNCTEIQQIIQRINQDNFFDELARVNRLEAEILIVIECRKLCEHSSSAPFTEEEILQVAKEDSINYFKEKCGLTLVDPTPYSLHFSAG